MLHWISSQIRCHSKNCAKEVLWNICLIHKSLQRVKRMKKKNFVTQCILSEVLLLISISNEKKENIYIKATLEVSRREQSTIFKYFSSKAEKQIARKERKKAKIYKNYLWWLVNATYILFRSKAWIGLPLLSSKSNWNSFHFTVNTAFSTNEQTNAIKYGKLNRFPCFV